MNSIWHNFRGFFFGEFLGVRRHMPCSCLAIPSKPKKELLHWVLLWWARGMMLSGPLRHWWTFYSLLGHVTPSHLLSDPKGYQVQLGPEWDRILQLMQGSMRSALPLGPCDPADPTVSAVAAARRHAIWSSWQAGSSRSITVQALRLWSKALQRSQIPSLLWRRSLGPAIGPL